MLRRRMDIVLYFTVVCTFAIWTSVHVLLCLRLFARSWQRGLAGFCFFPLAPYFGSQLRVPRLPSAWVASAAIYAVALLAALV